MIFVTDALGKATYVSSEWTDHTGQSLEVARNFGWAEALHPEDREIVRNVVADAISARSEFSVRYRLIGKDGRYMWVAAGAVASFGPPDRTFLGFLGSVTPIAEALTADLRAYGSVGRFAPPPHHIVALPSSGLELVADHLLMVHSLVVQLALTNVRPCIEKALHKVGLELARVEMGGADTGKLH